MPEEKPTPPPGSILDRVGKLEKKTRGKGQAAAGVESAIAAAIRRSARSTEGQDPALQDFREELFGELSKLIPEAIKQAKKGKPALLRILTRYTR